jgi:hypothetical protein
LNLLFTPKIWRSFTVVLINFIEIIRQKERDEESPTAFNYRVANGNVRDN